MDSDIRNTLIIIPAYNEEKTLPVIIEKIKQNCPSVDILVIDDGSSDLTPQAAKKLGTKVISHPFNLGYGATLQTGYRYAHLESYSYIVQIDADGQHDPEEIKILLDALQQNSADVVIGSRFLGKSEYQMSLIRYIGVVTFRMITSLIVRQKITDTTSGFIALNQRTVNFLSFADFPSDFPDADIIILLYFAGFRLKEVSVSMKARLTGRPMVSKFQTLYYVYKMLLSIFVTLLRKKPERRIT